MMVLGQYRAVLAGIWWYWVSRGQYLLILGGTWSVLGSNGWYLVILGQYKAVLTVTWLYLLSRGRHWFLLVVSDRVSKDLQNVYSINLFNRSKICRRGDFLRTGPKKKKDGKSMGWVPIMGMV